MPTPFWSSPTVQDRLERLERSGFSVEFLRRNPLYRKDFTRTLRHVARNAADANAASAELLRRWGLVFSS